MILGHVGPIKTSELSEVVGENFFKPDVLLAIQPIP